MGDVFKSDAERERYAADQRERHRANTVLCPHCGTPGAWTYGGLDPAWLGNGNAKLTEFSSERQHWYGVPEFSQDHTPERCIEALKKKLDVYRSALVGVDDALRRHVPHLPGHSARGWAFAEDGRSMLTTSGIKFAGATESPATGVR